MVLLTLATPVGVPNVKAVMSKILRCDAAIGKKKERKHSGGLGEL